MLKILLQFFFKNLKSIGLIFIIIFTTVIVTFSNHQKNLDTQHNNNFINNIYFKKTLNHLVDNLEPKYIKIKHKIKSGETFDKILQKYSIEKSEILKIKNSLKDKVNLNKLNTKKLNIKLNLEKLLTKF